MGIDGSSVKNPLVDKRREEEHVVVISPQDAAVGDVVRGRRVDVGGMVPVAAVGPGSVGVAVTGASVIKVARSVGDVVGTDIGAPVTGADVGADVGSLVGPGVGELLCDAQVLGACGDFVEAPHTHRTIL